MDVEATEQGAVVPTARDPSPLLSLELTLKQKRKVALSRIIQYSRPEAGIICVGIASLVVNSITNLSFPWIMGKALDHMSTTDKHNDNFGKYVLGTTSFFAVGSIASWLRTYCLGSATDRISSRLRQELFESYLDKDLEYFDVATSGELLTLLDEDVQDCAEIMTEKLASGLRSLNSALNGSVLLYLTSPRLCALSLSIVPLVGVGAMTLSKYSSKLAKDLRELQSRSLTYVIERLSNLATVRLNDRQHYEKGRYHALLAESNALSARRYHAKGWFMSFINISTNLSLVAVLYEGGRMLSNGSLTAGSLTRFALQVCTYDTNCLLVSA